MQVRGWFGDVYEVVLYNGMGAHGWVVPAMGALFNLGAGCQKWNPYDIPGTQPPLSDAVVNFPKHKNLVPNESIRFKLPPWKEYKLVTFQMLALLSTSSEHLTQL